MASYLITGCSRGIGLTLATQLASLPASEVSVIFATSRHESSALKDLIAKSGGRVIFVALETTSEESIEKAASEVERKLGGKGLDVLINNAGIFKWTPAGGITKMIDLQEHLATNVVGVQLVTAAFMPLLEKGTLKKIANISTNMGSIANAHTYVRGAHAYCISKAALNMLTVQYSLDYAQQGFTIFAISPGWLRTELGGGAVADLDVEVGAAATLDKILKATKEQNGEFMNIHVEGYEKRDGPNKYDGVNLPW